MILLLLNNSLVVEWSVVSHSFSWRTRFSRWKDVQEIFLLDEFTMLINHSNCCLVVPLVDLIDASSHDNEALSLRDKLIDVSIGVAIFDLPLMELVSLNLEVAIFDLLRVVFTTFSQHMIFCIFFQFCFDVIQNAIQERLLTAIHGVDLTIEILNNFESDVSPFGNIARILVIIKEFLEEFVSDSFILAMVVDLDFVLDET